MAMLSSVAGLRPWCAGRLRMAKLSKLAMETFSPRASAVPMAAKTALATLRGGLGHGGLCGHMGRQFGLVHGSSRFSAIVHPRGTRLRIRVPLRPTACNSRPDLRGCAGRDADPVGRKA